MAYEIKNDHKKVIEIVENLKKGMEEDSKEVIDLDSCIIHMKDSYNESVFAQTEITRLEKLLTDEITEKSVLSDSVTALSNVNKELFKLISGEIRQKATWLKDEDMLKKLSDENISTKSLIELKKSVDEKFNETFDVEFQSKSSKKDELDNPDFSHYSC